MFAIISGITPLIYYAVSPDTYRGRWHVIELPAIEKNSVKLYFEFRSTHPFLAEYEYRLLLKNGKKTVERHLFANCGGKTLFKVYRLKDGKLLLHDKDGKYIVDCNALEAWYLIKDTQDCVPLPHKPFTAFSCGESTCSFDDITVKKIPVSKIGIADQTYIGYIAYDFHPEKGNSGEL